MYSINDPANIKPLTPNHLIMIKSSIPLSLHGKFTEEDLCIQKAGKTSSISVWTILKQREKVCLNAMPTWLNDTTTLYTPYTHFLFLMIFLSPTHTHTYLLQRDTRNPIQQCCKLWPVEQGCWHPTIKWHRSATYASENYLGIVQMTPIQPARLEGIYSPNSRSHYSRAMGEEEM